MEPACTNLPRDRRADVFRWCAHNRPGRACRDADRDGRARGSLYRCTIELARGRGGACLGACLGAHAGYWHATYMLAIYEPLVTIVLFSLLALGAYYLSKSLAADYERLALTAARTSVFMVNFGFWIGSLWGDHLLLIHALLRGDPSIQTNYSDNSQMISPLAFVIGWLVVLLGAAIWAVRENRRWVVNVAAVFGAIHFYTQWFERLRTGADVGLCRRSPDARLRARTVDVQ